MTITRWNRTSHRPSAPGYEPVLTVEDRLSEILQRYRREHVVHRSIALAAGELHEDVVQLVAKLDALLDQRAVLPVE